MDIQHSTTITLRNPNNLRQFHKSIERKARKLRATIRTAKQARTIVHGMTPSGNVRAGLSNPSKMPGRGWSLPAKKACPVGGKLASIPGTVCHGCYADKGRYTEDGVAASLEARWAKVNDAQKTEEGAALWCAAMAHLIETQSPDVFRWHDAGDLFSDRYVIMVFTVIRMTKSTRHWIPTKEFGRIARLVVREGYAVPRNVTIRISAYKVGERINIPPHLAARGIRSSSVNVQQSTQCPAYTQNGECRDCRLCWSRGVDNTNYPLH